MQTGRPSETALAAAYARAYHQVAGDLRIFTDPLAAPMVGERPEDIPALLERSFGDVAGDPAFLEETHLLVAVRARLAEDTIAAASANGAKQVVVLGAGLDTFAYRNPHAEVRVFEVDYPATQAWKRERLAAAGITIPDTLTFAPVDFETGTLAEGLANAGFRRDEPTVFVWLGVLMYLTIDSVRTTLRFIAEQDAPSSVIADYLGPMSAMSAEHQETMQRTTELIADIGEPVLSFFTVDEFAKELRDAGFTEIEDFTASGLVGEYRGKPVTSSNSMNIQLVRATRR